MTHSFGNIKHLGKSLAQRNGQEIIVYLLFPPRTIVIKLLNTCTQTFKEHLISFYFNNGFFPRDLEHARPFI